GDLLRRIRESAGATLAQVAEITKIGRGYLRAIEANDFDMLPAPVYVRGFVVEYARVLGLDSEQVVSSFMTLYERFREGGR
ncbi:MAG: helix-turn-helix domain-containing protein, partial [Myxococcota bacterium]